MTTADSVEPSSRFDRGGMSSRRRRRLRRTLVGLVAVVLLCIGALLAARQFVPLVRPPSCEVAGISAGWFGFEPERVANASTISGIAVRRGLPLRAAVIATATAMQESKLRNLEHGDRDSLGLFQQRPSQGWGSESQILDPVYATNKFYDHLVKVRNYLNRPLTQAAQEVQRSGYPDAYARHEPEAQVLAEALTGARPEGITCRLEAARSSQAADHLVNDLRSELGVRATPGDHLVTVSVSSQQLAWAVGAWGVAHAQEAGIESVTVEGRQWTRGMDGSATQWHDANPAAEPDQVLFRLARRTEATSA